MACFRFKLWWMAQKMGRSGRDVPLETQFLLVETQGASHLEEDQIVYAVFLPLIEGPFRASLQGNYSGDELELCLESGDVDTKAASFSHAVFVHAGRTHGVKVDVQCVLETLGAGLGGRVELTRQYHQALDASVSRNFEDNGIIACMSHNTDALYCAKQTAVVRASDDFYPRDPMSHTIHVAAVAYNSVFLGEFMLPDWDMFHSLHPAAEYHASARAISGGPVYVRELVTLPYNAAMPISLKVLEHEIFTVSPIRVLAPGVRFAPLGLVDMYNAGGAIEDLRYEQQRLVSMEVKGCGKFGVYSSEKPRRCCVGTHEIDFSYDSASGLVTLSLDHMPEEGKRVQPVEVEL
ncbi:hypothetical protein J5N97_000534 [Dioscorea zingiberensis]|uniref:Uncharacterized protein n=1 Tax=Dioscorea zingiberensis TaxID=325984 RepID=A0A9D5H1I0_9LILI|nr:hypothetical protein J5N97_000534 [Dioscorea zingiberensis]